MARRNDRDDDDFDDRYERRNRSSGTKTVMIVLGIFGGIFFLSIASCAGVMYYGYTQAKKAITKIAGSNFASETFFSDLQGGRIEEAYNATSSNFKATTSRKQFEEIVKANPILKSHTNHTLTNPAFPQETNGKYVATMTYRLSEGTSLDEDDDPDDENEAAPKPKRKDKAKGMENADTDPKSKPAVKPQVKLVNVTVVEESGKWVIDKLDIP